MLDQAARLLLLLPGLALELGFYGAVLWFYGRHRKSYSADGPQRTALYLAGCGLLLALFVRSADLGNNDFGYRVAMLPQFLLLVLAADLLGSWWIEGRNAVVLPTAGRRKLAYGLIALGIAGTVYQVVLLRVFIPLEAGRPDSGFASLPAQVFEARTAFAELNKVASRSAVVEFNPYDPHPGYSRRRDPAVCVLCPVPHHECESSDGERRGAVSGPVWRRITVLRGDRELDPAALRIAGSRVRSGPSSIAGNLARTTLPWARWTRSGAMRRVGRRPCPAVASEPGFRIVRCSSTH